jgi:hypothetical protein
MSRENKATVRIAWRITIALLVSVLALAGCGTAATPPPTPAPTQAPPTPTQPAASETPVSAAGDVLGIWQVEGAAESPLLFIFAEFTESGRSFSAFAGSQKFDHGLFTVKENQLTFVTYLKTCRLCKGSYAVYVIRQDGRPARLRFVVNGQDANATRASALNGKTATLLTGALPGEVPLGAVEDVNGAWESRETPYGTLWLTFNSNGKYVLDFATEEVGWSAGFSAADGKLVFDTGTPDASSYTVFVRKQGDKVVQLRFVLLNDPYDVRAAVLQLNPWTPAER